MIGVVTSAKPSDGDTLDIVTAVSVAVDDGPNVVAAVVALDKIASASV